MLDLKLYTVGNLKSWLFDGIYSNGLSDKVIAPQRAWAIVHNPFVVDEDVVLAVIFVNADVAAYTAAFPEKTEQTGDSRIWWLSTLYCNPQYQGRGFGLVVVGSLMELYGEDMYFDSDGAKETIEIFRYYGHLTKYYNNYYLYNNKFKKSPKGLLLKVYEIFNKKTKENRLVKYLSNVQYSVCYKSFVSGESYHFISKHCMNHCWLRSQEMLSWICSYPFMQAGALQGRVKNDLYFTSNIERYSYQVVEVYSKGEMIGFYLYRDSSWGGDIPYIYYDNAQKEIVFASIIEMCRCVGSSSLETMDRELADYMVRFNVFDAYEIRKKSFSYPKWFDVKDYMQRGDGDMFVY